jgi:formylmethanofuran dehydrogenase subunit E
MDKNEFSMKISSIISHPKIKCRKCGEILVTSRSEESVEEVDCPFDFKGKCELRKEKCNCPSIN